MSFTVHPPQQQTGSLCCTVLFACPLDKLHDCVCLILWLWLRSVRLLCKFGRHFDKGAHSLKTLTDDLYIIIILTVVQFIVSYCCHAEYQRGWRGKGRSRPFRLERQPNHKEPFIQPLVPQLVLI